MKRMHRVRDFLAGALTLALVMGLAVPAGAALTGKTIQVLTGAEIYIDGVKMEPTDANGNPVETFAYNGTTYVPLRAVSEYLGKAVNWDGANQRVYIGEAPGVKQYLNTVCPPYQSSNFETYPTVEMSSQKYANAARYGSTGPISQYTGWALYNLNGQYETLSFDMGHLDGASMIGGTLNIYLDDNLVFSVDMDPEDLPEHYTVELHNALQMKIEMTNGEYRLANIEIY